MSDVRNAVEANGRKIAALHGRRLDRMLGEDCADIVRSAASPNGKYKKLLRLVNEAMSLVAPFSPCGEGCSHCCNMAVTVTEYEAQRIAAETGLSYVQQKSLDLEDIDSVIRQRDIDVRRYTRVPCPFLKDSRCSIYRVRPLPCRTYHSLEEDNGPCKLGLHGQRLEEVGMLNLMSFEMTHVMSLERHVFADIREWFPGVREGAHVAP